MRASVLTLSIASLLLMGTGSMRADIKYPLLVTLDAQIKSGVTTITSQVTVRVERAMLASWRTQVTDALQHGGYSNFVSKLRPLSPIGTIETQSAKVDIRYQREEPDGTGTRLVVIADRPLFFLPGASEKSKAGFDLTVVELRFDGKGGVTGQMSGAARVRPSPDGTVVLDTHSDELVQLKGRGGL